MPVSKSAKKALRTSTRRHQENLITKEAYKKAVKFVKKAVTTGTGEFSSLLSSAQSALDKAAKQDSIHPNKAARLKSRLAKKVATAGTAAPVSAKKSSSKKAPAKKTTTKKTTKK